MILEPNNSVDNITLLDIDKKLHYPEEYLYLKKTDVDDCLAVCLIKSAVNEEKQFPLHVKSLHEESYQRICKVLQEYQNMENKYPISLVASQPSSRMNKVLECNERVLSINKAWLT